VRLVLDTNPAIIAPIIARDPADAQVLAAALAAQADLIHRICDDEEASSPGFAPP